MIDEYTLSDEEKGFDEWLKKTTIKAYDIALVKKAFMDGYADGWNQKQKRNAEEQLQK